MDKFVETVGRGAGTCADYGTGKGLVMGYYDGNTVTGLWNYAQHFAMSDNSYSSTFGPSTPGALNLVSGQTHGFTADGTAVPATTSTVIGDPQPTGDKCDTRDTSSVVPGSTNKNVGDLLNAKGVSWGWFQGGFADCTATHTDVGGVTSKDYIPHHEPFQYYPSTANPQHTRPASVAEIGHAGPANHQYDLSDFWTSVKAGTMPSVSYLKARGTRTATPATPPRWTSSTSWSTRSTGCSRRRTGRTPRSSWPTTTATAGTTTRCRRSSTSPRTRPTR